MKKRVLLLSLCLITVLLALSLLACGEDPAPVTPTPTPEQPPAHEHSFGEWSVSVPATCIGEGRSVRACACGEQETQAIPATGVHNYGTDNVCTVCAAELPYTEGLTFAPINDGTAYAVIHIGTITAEHVVVPAYHEGLPVAALQGLLVSNGEIAQQRLTGLELPATVKSVDPKAFEGCLELSVIKVAADNPVYQSKGNCLIETATKTLVVGCVGSVIPADGSVIAIGANAFYCNTALTAITVPHTVKSIAAYAFEGCTALTSVVLAQNHASVDPDEPNPVWDAWSVGDTGLVREGQSAAAVAADLIGAYKGYTWNRISVDTGRH